ncbi:AraC family transcriptional regulator [Neptuniibacter caesariensis]|uniref:Putative transcription regulator protein n=1 Tax=Neptuniibacter caesariensis TaxID=207954 RepID=A0A7U8C804_NEPCE|nr:AraC family transcriptional regulator [Neptuniibacter caesariensis]EAR61534.1 putative transcription regulator protein [Oceanospirillum sp. MED92] [Neptuniibacter caesariensis]
MADDVQYHRVADTPDLVLSEGVYSDFQFEPHYHLDYHIGLVVEGVQKQKFQGRSVLLGPGRVSIMPPGEIHDGISYGDSPYKMKTFRISQEILEHYFADIFADKGELFFAGAMLEDPRCAAALLNLFLSLQEQNQLSSMATEEHWLKLLAPLLTDLCVVTPEGGKGYLSEKQWQQVREYCRESLDNKIVLDELAELCDLSRYQFLRRFEKTVGVTPHAWLTRFRLEHACALLRRTKQTLSEVSQAVGFYDQSHFNRAFRQAYGVSPSKY